MQVLQSCVVCGGDRLCSAFEIREPAGWWRIVRCTSCSHGFINPQPSWDELAPFYSSQYVPYAQDGHEAESDDVMLARAGATGELLHVPVRPGGRLLDVGCASGRFLQLARQLGMEVQGVEPSSIAAGRAEARGLPVFHGTLNEFAATAPALRYDIITANHVLEHVPDPVQVMQAMRTLLAQGGLICIAVPNADCWAARSLRERWHSTDVPRHLMQFTKRSLAECGTRAGLDAASIRTYSLPRATASSIRMWLRRRFLIPWRLSSRLTLINERLAPWLAGRLDRRGTGEAILGRFTAA